MVTDRFDNTFQSIPAFQKSAKIFKNRSNEDETSINRSKTSFATTIRF